MKQTSVRYTWRETGAVRGFRTGVSLHGHTHHSRENLRFLTAYRKDFAIMPLVLRVASWQHRRFTGDTFDIVRVTWHPPLTPEAALRLESAQIRALGLSPLVSLSDHDDIEAGRQSGTPVSIEWTVPVAPTFFHVGIHNLPRMSARAIAAELARVTASRSMEQVRAALAAIAALPGTLIVLNHPLWDEGEVGGAAHRRALDALVRCSIPHIHAFELNGLRPWSENGAAMDLAAAWERPVISGGDRHGKEPNANINLTNAATFSEFADEVRAGASHVAFLPSYREPLRLRWLLAARDIFGQYGAAESDAPNWRERFFYQTAGARLPLSELWPTARPLALRPFFAALELAARRV
jgi:hypothetical protein